MVKILKSIKKHKKQTVIIVCAAAVAAVIYTDVFNLSGETPVSDYLYTSDKGDSGTKILGEAALVDSSSDEVEKDDSFFVEAIINKEKSRDEALETLQVVVESSETLPDVTIHNAVNGHKNHHADGRQGEPDQSSISKVI